MMVKINGEYLEFSSTIEVERQTKLFENIDTTDGDYSYQFEAPWTSNNFRILGNPMPDNILKPVYQRINCELISDDGLSLYKGFLRVEGITNFIKLSFFSGNNSWFGLLSGPISDIDFSSHDIDQNFSNIVVRMSATSGVTFPLVDNGGLITRGYRQAMVEDYVPGMYVHTIFKAIFQHHSIKLQGELLTDALFNQLIILRNSKSQAEIDSMSTYAEKSTTTSRPSENVDYKMTFQNDSVYPYFDGDADAFDVTNSIYTAPARIKVRVEAGFIPQIVDADYNQRIYLYINGIFTFVDIGLDAGGLYNSATPGDMDEFTIDRTIILEEGDTLEVYTEWQQSLGTTQNDVLSGWLKITPIYIYKAYGNAIVPPWSQIDFVSNIFRIFNVIPSYEPITATLTINLFEKIKSKEPIELSEYISSTEVDFIEFISNYGKRNLFSYQQVEFDDPRQYNIQNFFKYAQGVIEANNDFLDDSKDVVESDFSHPQSYLNAVFDMSMERTGLIQMDTDTSTNFTAVTGTTTARFTVDRDIFLVDDIVRIEGNNRIYNKDWIVTNTNPETSPGAEDGWIEVQGLGFDTDDSGTITKLVHSYNETSDVFLLINIPFYLVSNFSGFSTIRLDSFDRTEMSLAYFNLLQTGRQINEDYTQSLSFGEIEDPLFYQQTIIDMYWGLFGRMVNDPVKLKSQALIPFKTHLDIDFLRPITIKTEESTNMYYLNRQSGYEGSESAIELIKLP